METNKKKYLLYVGMTILFVIAIVGVSYAAYVFSGTGTTENVITTGNLEISFAEQNNILIKDRYPETDTEGLANTDSNSQMTFTVSSNIVGNATVNYAVGLAEIEEDTTLTQDYIKINLTKNGSAPSGFNAITGKTIKSFENETFGELLTSHVITKGSITGTQVDTYNLKAWISEEYNLPTTDTSSGNSHSASTTSEEFSFKIKVAGTDAVINEEEPNIPNAPELATNMIPVTYDSEHDTWVKADSTNANNSWYNYDKKVWANAVTVTEVDNSRSDLVDAEVGTPIPMERINTMWVWIPRFSATTNTLDCSTLENPSAEKYPQCYQNLSDTDKEKAMGALQAYGDANPEETLNKLLNGETITLAGMTGDLKDVVDFYNQQMAPDSITIIYDKFNPNKKETKYNGTGDINNPGAFNIEFVTTNETSHDAFTFGNDELSGMWIAKFAPSHSELEFSENTQNNLACTNDACENAKGIEILPNKVFLEYNSVSNFFYAGRSLEQTGNNYGLVSNEIDTHMMKNSEWGAVAYLTQSIYGRCNTSTNCTDVGKNFGTYVGDEIYFLTGYRSNFDFSANTLVITKSGKYDTPFGMDASTTGNIYGIYDMAGVLYEYVMGVYTDGTNLWSGYNENSNSGFNGCLGSECSNIFQSGLDFPNEKYYNTYTTEVAYTSSGLQHALTETYNWYDNSDGFVYSFRPWLLRGGSGIFSSVSTAYDTEDNNTGRGYELVSFRPVLVK